MVRSLIVPSPKQSPNCGFPPPKRVRNDKQINAYQFFKEFVIHSTHHQSFTLV